jgi:hypothetical protein
MVVIPRGKIKAKGAKLKTTAKISVGVTECYPDSFQPLIVFRSESSQTNIETELLKPDRFSSITFNFKEIAALCFKGLKVDCMDDERFEVLAEVALVRSLTFVTFELEEEEGKFFLTSYSILLADSYVIKGSFTLEEAKGKFPLPGDCFTSRKKQK